MKLLTKSIYKKLRKNDHMLIENNCAPNIPSYQNSNGCDNLASKVFHHYNGKRVMTSTQPKKHILPSNKRLFGEREAVEYLGVSSSYLRQDRMNGKFKNRTPGPQYCCFGKMIRYTKEALDQWIEAHAVSKYEG